MASRSNSFCHRAACVVVVLLAHVAIANAQSFPSDAAWTAVQQNAAPIGDVAGDGNGLGRDVVGDTTHPLLYVASDASFLYFRLRLDTTPLNGAVLRPYGWGIEIDTNANLASYEYLVEVDGGAGQVELARNTMPTATGDPRDLAEDMLFATPVVMGTNVRVADALFPAPASMFGGTADSFLDFAIPWSALLAAGLTRTQLVQYVAGTSNNNQTLNVDVSGTATPPGDGALVLAKSDPIPLGLETPGADSAVDAGVDALPEPDAMQSDTDGGVPGPAFHLEGGGCASSTPGIGALLPLLLVLLVRKRRYWLGAVFALLVPAVANAQSSASFTLDRFRLATDRDGMLDVESARLRRPLELDVALAFGYAADELVVVDDRGREVGTVIGHRVGANLAGSIGIARRLQLGLELPIVLSQGGSAGMDVDLPHVDLAAVGDLRLAPKIGLLAADSSSIDLAIVPAVSLPTASSDSFVGEHGISFLPELVVSRSLHAVRLALDAGAFLRRTATVRDTTVGNEVFARLGCGFLLDVAPHPVELDASLSFSRTIESDSQATRGELLGGASYALTTQLAVFAAGGFGIDHGFGAPEWRALAGSRLVLEPPSHPRPATFAAPAPPPEAAPADHDEDGIVDDVDACPLEPEDHNGHEDDDGCPEPVAP